MDLGFGSVPVEVPPPPPYAYGLPAIEEAAAVEAASALAGTGEAAAAGEAVAIGVGEAAATGEAVAAEGLLTTAAATSLAAVAALLVLLWPSPIAPEPPITMAGPNPSPKPEPVPEPNPESVTTCPQQSPCDALVKDIRDAINRDKRQSGNKGIHGLRNRWQELITGPCGPGQLPYRVNHRGEYVRTPVWENHVDEFNRTKNALRNRFYKAINAGCTIPDDLVDEAADAERMEPPNPKQWKGDPSRPCTDSSPPPGWQGPLESPKSRGLIVSGFLEQ